MRSSIVCASLATLLVAAVTGCAGAGANETVTPVLRSEVAFLSGSPAATTTIVTEEWAPDEPVGPPLAALSSAEEIREAIEAAHGPTNDITEELSRFVDFPAVPTPEHTLLTELRADVRTTADGTGHAITAEVTFTTDASVDNTLTLFETALGDLDWESTDRTTQLLNGVVTSLVRFEIPGSAYDRHDFEIVGKPGSDERAIMSLRYVEVAPIEDSTVHDRLVGWAEGLPLPDGGQITGAGVQTSSVGRDSLHYSLVVIYDQLGPNGVASDLRSALPTPAFAIDDRPVVGDATDNWVYLSSPFFDDARVSTHSVATSTGPLTRINVDARIEFEPRSRPRRRCPGG